MINLTKKPGEEHWPDNWTAVTVDGNPSAQFEETLLYALVIPFLTHLHTDSNYFLASRKPALRT